MVFLHATQILEKKNVDNQLAFQQENGGQPTNSLAYIYIYIYAHLSTYFFLGGGGRAQGNLAGNLAGSLRVFDIVDPPNAQKIGTFSERFCENICISNHISCQLSLCRRATLKFLALFRAFAT